MRTSHDKRYLPRERITPYDFPPSARLLPVTRAAILDVFEELLGYRPSEDRVYEWRTRGFIVKRRAEARAILLPCKMSSLGPRQPWLTSPAAVRAWWRAAKAEAELVGGKA